MSERAALLKEAAFFPLARATENRKAIAALRDRFETFGYSEAGVVRTLGTDEAYAVGAVGREIWRRYNLRDDDPAHVMISVFLLGIAKEEAVLAQFLRPDELSLLRDVRLLVESSGKLIAPVSVYPVGDLYIATDLRLEPDQEARQIPTRVMPLGRDSYGLARLAASSSGETALDLCTGSGVVALKIAKRCDKVVGVDINPRAVNFARFNAILNGARNCDFVVGDLFEPVAGRRFDLVTANPPFVPVPDTGSLLYRDGGRSGEDVLRRVISESPSHLEDGGTCLIATDLVHHRLITYEDKLRSWLEREPSVTTVIVEAPSTSSTQYALDQLLHGSKTKIPPELFRWIDHYRAEGIDAVSHGYIAMHRNSSVPTTVLTLPISGAFQRDVGQGLVAAMMARIEGLGGVVQPDVSFYPVYQLADVELIAEASEMTGFRLPYLLASVIDSLREEKGAVSKTSIVARLSEAGYHVGPERESELDTMLRQFHAAGYLVRSEDPDVEKFQRIESRRSAAMRLWWSQ